MTDFRLNFVCNSAKSKLSIVPDESKLSIVPNSAESKLSVVPDSAESKLSVSGTTMSFLILIFMNQFLEKKS